MTPKKDQRFLSEKRSLREVERRRSNRETILHAAEAVICRKGLNAASMDDVAAEAGFSKATLYKYVQGKSELVFELLIHFMEEMTARFQSVSARPLKPEAKLQAFLREVLRYQAEKENISRAFMLDPSHSRIIRAVTDDKGHPDMDAERAFLRRFQAARRAINGLVEEFLRDGIAAGVFRSMPLEAGVRYLGMVIQGYQHEKFFRESKPDIEKDVLDIHGFILRGFKTEKQVND